MAAAVVENSVRSGSGSQVRPADWALKPALPDGSVLPH